jgi:hypothetical protein
MSCDDALKVFGSYMSQYEKDEIKLFDTIYYLSFSKRKQTGQTTSHSIEH